MNTPLQLFHTPYPSMIRPWKAIVVPAAIIFLILGLLQPFGISHLETSAWSVAAVSALIAAGTSTVSHLLLPALFPAWYDERRWTIGKETLHLSAMFLLIAFGVCLWVAWLADIRPSVRLFFIALLWVLVLGIFPTVLFMLWNQNLLLKRNLREARELDNTLSAHHTPEQAETKMPHVTLTFRNGTKDMLKLPAFSFLYAESEGNYIKLYYRPVEDGSPATRLVRITMKQAEESAAACPSIIRCHRAFLVNLNKVVKVDGNQQGYRLRLEGCEDEIPVSRAYAKTLKERLSAVAGGK